MSFSFNAVGRKADVLRQLDHVTTHGNEAGEAVAALIRHHLRTDTAQAGHGHEYHWIVKASGHSGGGSPFTLQVTVEPLWVPAPPAKTEELAGRGVESEQPDTGTGT